MPDESTILTARIVDTYWVMMSFVSAPGWSNRFRVLTSGTQKHQLERHHDHYQDHARRAQFFNHSGSFQRFMNRRAVLEYHGWQSVTVSVGKSSTHSNILQSRLRIWEIHDDFEQLLDPKSRKVGLADLGVQPSPGLTCVQTAPTARHTRSGRRCWACAGNLSRYRLWERKAR